jgi:cyclopropane fatty-acyl-phospholipid synthase-like methyltransferase
VIRQDQPSREFVDTVCTAPAARSNRMRDIVLAHVPRGRSIRVLDLGCGTGSLLFRLAEALPAATLVGIDVSSANIRAAKQQQLEHASMARVQFELADYLTYRAQPFDAIVTDGVLHLVRAETVVLVRKLAADLRPRGLLVCAMPFDCAYNRTFAVVRRALGRIRAPWLDRRILQLGRLLHGRHMDDAGLRERVPYMYMPPERLMDDALEECFASAGLERTAEYPALNTSPSQLKHRVTIFVRRDA